MIFSFNNSPILRLFSKIDSSLKRLDFLPGHKGDGGLIFLLLDIGSCKTMNFVLYCRKKTPFVELGAEHIAKVTDETEPYREVIDFL